MPREVRQLGETLLQWVLSNLARDVVSPFGDLPRRFGFDCDQATLAPLRAAPYHVRLTPNCRLFVLEARVIVAHGHGSVILSPTRFALSQSGAVVATSAAGLPRSGEPPITPVHWVLGWASLARSFALFATYERWVVTNFGERYRREGDLLRPKAARRCAVPLLDLGMALDGVAEWCSDAEVAMLTWIIADARRRRIAPDIPTL